MAHPDVRGNTSRDGTVNIPGLERNYKNKIKEHLRKSLIDGFSGTISLQEFTGSEEGQLTEQQAQETEDVIRKAIEDFSDTFAQSIFEFCFDLVQAFFAEHVHHLHGDIGNIALTNDSIVVTKQEVVDNLN